MALLSRRASSAELEYRWAWTHPILFSPNNPDELLIGSQYVMRSDDHGDHVEDDQPRPHPERSGH